jgi:FKBP-type peptidyl-prolyl cis-trans isomerase SlyD
MELTGEHGDGKKYEFTIVEIKGDDIYMDGNHPWAGKTLHFSVEVMEIREATTEELKHGHVHGEGGHHH